MNSLQALLEKLQDAWRGLTDRERKLMLVLAGVLAALLVFLFLSSQIRSAAELRDGADARRAAISALIDKRSEYATAVAQQRALSAKMSGNAVSVPSFVETQCRVLNITRPTNFRDSRSPVANNAAVTALTTEVVFPQMTLTQLSDFSNAVYSSGELLYIQRIEVKEKRGRNAGEGFEVAMQLTTYQLNEGE